MKLSASLFTSYGMTECCGKISVSRLRDKEQALPLEEQIKLVGSQGRPFFGTNLKLVGDDGTPSQHGEVGEVLIRGDSVFSG